MAQTSPHTGGPSERVLSFQFAADRFGYRSEEHELSPQYAAAAKKVLEHWRDTVEDLFGDIEGALALAQAAHILPDIDWRNLTRALNMIALPIASQAVAPSREDFSDQTVRSALRDIQEFLGMLREWAEAFQVSVRACLIASVGSPDLNAIARRREGLKAVGAVYQLNQDDPKTVFEKLRVLAPSSGPVGETTDWWMKIASRTDPILRVSTPLKSTDNDDPLEIDQWLTRLDKALDPLLKTDLQSAVGTNWKELADRYWLQWSWRDSGPKRASGSEERSGKSEGPTGKSEEPSEKSEEPTILDLIHAAHHGGSPVVPVRGGNLSILQWSRIIALFLHRIAVARDAVVVAGNKLSIFEPDKLVDQPDKPIRLERNIIAIRPQSAQSLPAAWQPDPKFPALALMPPDIAAADQRASQSERRWSNAEPDADRREEIIDPLTDALKEGLTQSIVQFDEAATDDPASARFRPRDVARPSISHFYFGYGSAAGSVPGPYLDRRQGVSHLMKLAAERDRDRLPPSFVTQRTFWQGLKFVWRAWLHGLAAAYGRLMGPSRSGGA